MIGLTGLGDRLHTGIGDRLCRNTHESSFPAHLLSPAPRGARATRTIAAARLADVHTGNRNETLFLRLRQWARSAVRGCTHRGEFDAMVLERACAISASFPCEPEPDAAVRATAYSVARYAWERRHQRDYSAEQRRRGGVHSGIVRAERAARHDEAILARRAQGESVRAIGRALGIAPSTVHDRIKASVASA